MSSLNSFNATMYMSRATSYDMTQVLVAPQTLARPKELVLEFSLRWFIFKILDKKG
jgi:hypothetical protein